MYLISSFTCRYLLKFFKAILEMIIILQKYKKDVNHFKDSSHYLNTHLLYATTSLGFIFMWETLLVTVSLHLHILTSDENRPPPHRNIWVTWTPNYQWAHWLLKRLILSFTSKQPVEQWLLLLTTYHCHCNKSHNLTHHVLLIVKIKFKIMEKPIEINGINSANLDSYHNKTLFYLTVKVFNIN